MPGWRGTNRPSLLAARCRNWHATGASISTPWACFETG
ncbi:hypothetical protein SC1_03654 [Sphingopyxis sp. C-1]|nr:hypothetical protein SC1_03654 [Sphingopyxis sp. C-1]